MAQNFFKFFLNDLKVELFDEFDRNFERKAFFDQPWPETIIPNKRGSLMMRSAALRRGDRAQVQGSGINFTNSMAYAKIQNEGGDITITAKMKKYFWAMYYSLAGGMIYSIKTRSANNTARNRRLNTEAAYWKALALKKVGDKLTIRPRRFIGPHPQVDAAVKRVADANIKEVSTQIKQHLKR